MKKKLISIFEKWGFDMSTWKESDEPQELSEAHVDKMEAEQKAAEQLKTENEQLKTDVQTEKTAREKVEGELVKSNNALELANNTMVSTLKDLNIDVKVGMTINEGIEKLKEVAGGKPGAEHTTTTSEGDDLNEEQQEIDQYDHNKTADEAIG